jgi:hypothetical protein
MNGYLQKFKISEIAKVFQKFSSKDMSDFIARATRVVTQMDDFLDDLNNYTKKTSSLKISVPRDETPKQTKDKLQSAKSTPVKRFNFANPSINSTPKGSNSKEFTTIKKGTMFQVSSNYSQSSKPHQVNSVIGNHLLIPKNNITQKAHVPAFSTPMYSKPRTMSKETDTQSMASQIIANIKNWENDGKITILGSVKKIVSLFRIRETIHREEKPENKFLDKKYDVPAFGHKPDDISVVASVVAKNESIVGLFNPTDDVAIKREKFDIELVNQLTTYAELLYGVIQSDFANILPDIKITHREQQNSLI